LYLGKILQTANVTNWGPSGLVVRTSPMHVEHL
jgi:hypothetical protein